MASFWTIQNVASSTPAAGLPAASTTLPRMSISSARAGPARPSKTRATGMRRFMVANLLFPASFPRGKDVSLTQILGRGRADRAGRGPLDPADEQRLEARALHGR